MQSNSFKKLWIIVGALLLAPLSSQAGAKKVPPPNRVSMEKARGVAAKAYNGKIQGEELEFEGGKWIYSFDLKSAEDNRIHEVHVDAISGKLLDVHAESASDEKKEMIEDAKEGSAE